MIKLNCLPEGHIFNTTIDGEVKLFIIYNGVPIEYVRYEDLSITEKERDYIYQLIIDKKIVDNTNKFLIEKLLKMFK